MPEDHTARNGRIFLHAIQLRFILEGIDRAQAAKILLAVKRGVPFFFGLADEFLPVAENQRTGRTGLRAGRLHIRRDPVKAEMTFRHLVLSIVAGNVERTGGDAEFATDALIAVCCHGAFCRSVDRPGRADIHASCVIAVHASLAEKEPANGIFLRRHLAVLNDVKCRTG